MLFFFRVASLRTVSVRKRRHLLIRWEFVLLFVQNWVDGKELSRYFQRQFNSTRLWITSDTNQIKESALHRGIKSRPPSLIYILFLYWHFTGHRRETPWVVRVEFKTKSATSGPWTWPCFVSHISDFLCGSRALPFNLKGGMINFKINICILSLIKLNLSVSHWIHVKMVGLAPKHKGRTSVNAHLDGRALVVKVALKFAFLAVLALNNI